ncbi:hypothetical protein EVAR_33709_1 [Eumeta japonica]|uniref:Uncharacterized protein n=1 Tax=Eumeta variegata TaxID=151549 RepID=A0A4C1VRJ8_EUMVA|nr:hypothetical protein EVAR_33709_1 [Eumeta japonica]
MPPHPAKVALVDISKHLLGIIIVSTRGPGGLGSLRPRRRALERARAAADAGRGEISPRTNNSLNYLPSSIIPTLLEKAPFVLSRRAYEGCLLLRRFRAAVLSLYMLGQEATPSKLYRGTYNKFIQLSIKVYAHTPTKIAELSWINSIQ